MARYRSRSRSYSPRRPRSRTPPRLRKRHDDDGSDDEPRDRYRDSRSRRDRRSPLPSGLLVRNLPLTASAEDLRIPFQKYGPVKDIYLPKNYHTGEPRGFGFVKYRYGEDAAIAKERMNHRFIGGREIRIVFAEENRKTPQEMSSTGGRTSSRHGGSSRHRSPPRSPRRRFRSSSRSASPPRRDTRDHRVRDDHHTSRRSRSISRSYSPQDEERDHRSNRRSPSPVGNGRSPQEVRDHASGRSMSPKDNRFSPSLSGSRSYD